MTRSSSGAPEYVLRPGESVEFRCRGWDPVGDEMTWYVWTSVIGMEKIGNGEEVSWRWDVDVADIADPRTIVFYVHSSRPYSRRTGGSDDEVSLAYRVLPPR